MPKVSLLLNIMTPIKNTAHVFQTWHVLLWTWGGDGPSSLAALRVRSRGVPHTQSPQSNVTHSVKLHRELLAQVNTSHFLLRGSGHPCGLATWGWKLQNVGAGSATPQKGE